MSYSTRVENKFERGKPDFVPGERAKTPGNPPAWQMKSRKPNGPFLLEQAKSNNEDNDNVTVGDDDPG